MSRPVSLIGNLNNRNNLVEQPRDIHGNIIVFPRNTRTSLQQKQISLLPTTLNNRVFRNKQCINNNFQRQTNTTIPILNQGSVIVNPSKKLMINDSIIVQKPIVNSQTLNKNNLNFTNHLNNTKKSAIITRNRNISPLSQKILFSNDKSVVRPRLSALEIRAKSSSPRKTQSIRTNNITPYQSSPVKVTQLTQFYKQSILQQVEKNNQNVNTIIKNQVQKSSEETNNLNSKSFPIQPSITDSATSPTLQTRFIRSQATKLSNSHFFNTMSKIQNSRMVNTQSFQNPVQIRQKIQQNEAQTLILKNQMGFDFSKSNSNQFTSPQIRALMITKTQLQPTPLTSTINKQALPVAQGQQIKDQIKQQNIQKNGYVNKHSSLQIPIYNNPITVGQQYNKKYFNDVINNNHLNALNYQTQIQIPLRSPIIQSSVHQTSFRRGLPHHQRVNNISFNNINSQTGNQSDRKMSQNIHRITKIPIVQTKSSISPPIFQKAIDQERNQYIQVNPEMIEVIMQMPLGVPIQIPIGIGPITTGIVPIGIYISQTDTINHQQTQIIEIHNVPQGILVPQSFPLSDIQYDQIQNDNNQNQIQNTSQLHQEFVEQQNKRYQQQQIQGQLIISTEIHQTVITSVTVNQEEGQIIEVLTTQQIVIRDITILKQQQQEQVQMIQQNNNDQILIIDQQNMRQDVKQSFEQNYENAFEQKNEQITSSHSISSQPKLIQAKITQPLSFSPNKFPSSKSIVSNRKQNIIKQTNETLNDYEYQGYSSIERVPVINSVNYQKSQIVD